MKNSERELNHNDVLFINVLFEKQEF